MNLFQLADCAASPPSIGSGCQAESTGHGPDWSRLAQDPVLCHLFDCASQRDGEPDTSADVIAILLNKLSDFLQEGVLDAVLPYVVPRVPDNSLNGHARPSAAPVIQTPQMKTDGRRRSRASISAAMAQQDNKPE